MMDITWRDDFLVGVDVIDDQHRQLFRMLTGLDRTALGDGEEDLTAVVQGLLNYLKEHFSLEEELLRNHPRWEEHHQEHWRFTEKSLQFLWDLKRADAPHSLVLAAEIRDFLYDWLCDHIMRIDQQHFRELA